MTNTTCSECGEGRLITAIYGDDFRHQGVLLRVEGLECCICDHCGADPVFADQIRKNELRIAEAKRRHGA